jgi:hypothetical protein
MRAIASIIALMLVPAYFIAGAASKGKDSQVLKTVTPVVKYEFGGGAGHYNYAPSFIKDKYGIIYGYLCQNRDPFKIVDYIYLYKGIPTPTGLVWQPGTEVIEPSRTGWDDCHICDPDVRRFTVKDTDGKQHKWIMTYLGVDQWDCNHNQIGLAIADNIEGPWTKCDNVNPIVPYDRFDRWGTGQSTSVVLNDSTIALFYHTTTENSPHAVRMVNLSDLSHIDIGKEYRTNFPAGNVYISPSAERIYAVTEERSPHYEKEIPTWVGDICNVYYKERSGDFLADVTAPLDTWTLVGTVTPELSGFPRNHNPGFLTDEKGWIPDENNITVLFTPAVTGEDWLWSYDLYSALFPMKDYLKSRNNK